MRKSVLIGLTVLSSAAVAQVIPLTPVAKWEFTGAGVFSDGSGNGYHCISTSSPSSIPDRCNNSNSAIHFNSSLSNYLETPNAGSTLLNNYSRSVAFWMRTSNSASGGTGTVKSIFTYGKSKNQTGFNGGTFEIDHNYCANGIGLDVSNQAVTAAKSCLTDGNWHHVAATFAGGGVSGTVTFENILFYVDGVLLPNGSAYCNNGGTGTILNTIAGPMFFGCNVETPKIRFYEGDLDDVYLYDRVLTQSEIDGLLIQNCGITSNPCFCNSQNIFTTPTVAGATSYAWSLPPGWIGSSSSNVILASLGTGAVSGNVTVTITTSCGKIIRRLPNASICNNTGGALNLTVSSNTTMCGNANTCLTLTATATSGGSVSYYWQSPASTGSSVVICPTVTTIYTVVANPTIDACPGSATIMVTVVNNCCPPDPNGISQPTLTSIGGSYTGGTYVIMNNITLSSDAYFNGSELLFGPNVQLTVPATLSLNLDGAHLYACGTKMWQGINVQDGASITSSNNNASLLEDAIIGIDLSNITPTHAAIPIDIENLTLNKNYIGIKINNDFASVNNLALRILGCVFSSRNLPFTSTIWPSASVSDLRFAVAGATADIAPPYLLNSYAQTNLKFPYNNQSAQIGIKIENIGNSPAMATNAGIDIGAFYQGGASSFNLFDGLGVGIDIMDASLTTMNNVFQNMVYMQNIPGMYGSGIEHKINSPIDMNARLDLRPVGASNQVTDYGNRFWNCYTAIHTENVFEFDIEYGIFRSDQRSSFTGFAPGYEGIHLESNRFDYNMKLNEFNNLHYGINIDNTSGSYDMGSGSSVGIFASSIFIEQNYFGPHVNSSNTLLNNEYFGDAIHLNGPNAPVYQTIASSGAFIISNKIDRAYRGISVNSMFDYPITIAGNKLLLWDDLTFSNTQYGIEAFDNQGNLSIINNDLQSTNILNNLMTLISCSNNSGFNTSLSIGSPNVSCNTLFNSYQAFEFIGGNPNTFWKGNSMNTHNYGLVLSSNGVIGTQGNPAIGCGNTWNGCLFDTWCNGSGANLSTLWVQNASPFLPTIHGGSFTPYLNGSNVLIAKRTSYQCTAITYPPLPSQRSIFGNETSADVDQSLANDWKVNVSPNPTRGEIQIRTEGGNDASKVKIIDLTGKVVFSAILNSDQDDKLNISHLKSSLYFIEIENSDKQVIRKKLVLQ